MLTLFLNNANDVFGFFSKTEKNQISYTLSSEIESQFELEVIFNIKTAIKQNLVEILSLKPQEKSIFLFKTIPQEFITPPPKTKL